MQPYIYIIREEASIFAPQRLRKGSAKAPQRLRKGSASTGLCESPRVPSERYEPRPCLCVFVACFDRRIFYYSSKTDSWWGCVAKVTASHLLMARPRHCLSATHGWPSLNNSQCSSPTLYTHTVYIELHGRRQAGSEGQGRSAGE